MMIWKASGWCGVWWCDGGGGGGGVVVVVWWSGVVDEVGDEGGG